MKKFKFNLSALLKIRKRVEERIIQEFSDQQRRVHDQQQLLNKMIESRDQIDGQVREAKINQVDIALEKSFDEYLKSLQVKIQEAQAELVLLQEELEKRREAMIKASQDVTVLEKLKEHRLNDYNKELTKEEQDFLDEVALSNRRVDNQLRRIS